MKQNILLACCFAGSLFFATKASAQTGDIAVSMAAPHSEMLRPPALESENHTPASAIEQPEYDALYDADMPPAPNFFPSNFRDLSPKSAASPSLMFGLLGLLLLGLVFSGLSGLGAKKSK